MDVGETLRDATRHIHKNKTLIYKGKVGNDQEMAQSERNSHSKPWSGKINKQLGTYTKKTYC